MKSFLNSRGEKSHNYKLILGLLLALELCSSGFAALSSFAQSPNTTNSISIKFVGNYPWLVPGAYADYTIFYIGEAPFFVTPSGQLLMMAPEQPGTPNNPVNGWLPGSGSGSLNWTVFSRLGNNISLVVSFNTVGCQDNFTAYQVANQSAAPCTYYNYSSKVTVDVNLTSGDAYVNGVDQGLLDFWGPPLLPANATIFSGSVYIDQKRFDSLANVSTPFESTDVAGNQPVNVSGTTYTSPIKLYGLFPTTFGEPNANFRIGWLHSSGNETNAGHIVIEEAFGPEGGYDYYNGLGYDLPLPQYPINQTICQYNHGQPTGCVLANVSTTLGQFSRSGGGTFLLSSTNIPLGPDQEQQQSPVTQITVLLAAEIAIPLVVIGIALFIFYRKYLGHSVRSKV